MTKTKPTKTKRAPAKAKVKQVIGKGHININIKPDKQDEHIATLLNLQLGKRVAQPTDPEHAKIDIVPVNTAQPFVARFVTSEFTSLCPVTGQPDFATIVIDYLPEAWLIESKSLKLYLTSFRNVGDFHEACVNRIATKLFLAANPTYLRVVGLFNARGGICIDVVTERGDIASRPDTMLPLPSVR